MAGWWETQLQGAPGWLALRGDIITGCTRLIDWPCYSVARDELATALLSFFFFLRFFPLFSFTPFLLHSESVSSLPLSFFLYLFVLSWTLPLSSVSPLSLFVAGFSRLAVVCWGCCTTFCPRMPLSVFWRREKPWISGFSPAKHKPGMTPTCIYTQSVCIQQSWDAPLQQEVKNYLRSCWQTA